MIFEYDEVLRVIQTEEYAQILAERRPQHIVFFAELAPMED